MIRIAQIRRYAHGDSSLPAVLRACLRRDPLRGSGFPCIAVLLALALAVIVPQVRAQSDFNIQSAAPSFIGAGANGATLVLSGSLSGLSGGGFQVCFYNGASTSTPITPTVINNVTSIAVPASSIQGVAASSFTAANGYSVAAQVYVASLGATTCDGTFDSTVTNSFSEPISEPLLGTYLGPTNIPQTNSATSVQAPPVNIVISGSNFTPATTVTLGSLGAVTPKLLSPSAISIAVPTALSSSAVGTTASITVCNGTTYCSGAASTLMLTVTGPVPSAGTLTITPTPVTQAGTTTLTAQFKRDPANGATLPEPGAPSGIVTFGAAGNTVSTAPLVLDTGAVFVSVATTSTIPASPTPIIAPPAGTYIGSKTITLSDSAAGAAIYYTTDGSTPTTGSTLYSAPFSINASGTVSAIALASGFRPSAVASNAYTITILPASALAFVTQPATAATGVAIAPAVQVAVVDSLGNTITTSTARVSLRIATNPGQGTLAGTLTQNAVNGIATFADLSIVSIANGYTLTAVSGKLIPATSNAFNITPYPISVKLFAPLIGVTSTLPGSFTLSHPAPAGVVTTVSLVSSDTTLVTVSPASVVVPVGQTTGTFTYTGVQPTSNVPPANNNLGVATITASAPNYLAGSASTTETYSLVSLSNVPAIAPAQVLDLATSLATNAPAGGITIYFTSSDPTIATIAQSVFVPAGQRTASANPQITGVKIGTTNIVATAQGYAPAYRTVNVTVVASFSPANITINVGTTNVASLNITAPAQTGGLTFSLSSDDTTKVTVPATITIPAGQTSVPIPVTGIVSSNGYIAVRANSPGVAEAVLSVNVNNVLSFYYANETTGVNLQVNNDVYLPSAPPAPVTVTITSSDPTAVVLAKDAATAGSGSISFTNVTSAGYLGFQIQGKRVTTSPVTLTVSATGYVNATAPITVNPSGFVFNTGYNAGISTTTFSSPYGLGIYPAILNTDLSYYTTGTLSPGVGTVNVPVTSSVTTVGTIVTSPVVFQAGDTSQGTTFKPAGAAGTSTIALGTAPPAGFSKPTNYQSFTATVTAPSLSFYYTTEITGVKMQVDNNVALPQTPPSPVTVTITSSDPTAVVLAKDGATVGTGTITFTNVTSAGYVGNFKIQGLRVTTSPVTLTVTATGYNSATSSITVNPSGFVFNTGYNGGISTTTFSSPYGLAIYPAILNTDLSYYTTATVSPGVGTVNVPVTSSVTTVGTIVTSPVAFQAGDTSQGTTFKPAGAAGTSTIALGTTPPAGFSKPTNYQSFTATVTAPSLSFSYTTEITGVKMQVDNNVYLPQAPPSPVTVTITSSDPTAVVLAKDGATVGTGTITFTNVTSAGYVGNFKIQGLRVTTSPVTLTVTATGYSSATSSITVNPSGFVLSPGYQTFSTTTFSNPNSLYVYPAILNADLSYYTTGTLSPGITPVNVPVVSSNTVVGTIAGSPLTFGPGDTSQAVTFQPTSAGTTNVSITEPVSGYSTPSNSTVLTATVTAPALSLYNNNLFTGVQLQNSNDVYLPVAPPNPVTVTITSNGTALFSLSKDPTAVGTPTITFTNVTSAGYVGTFYVQGQTTQGSSTVTASAPGFTNGVGKITVQPSGFAFNNTSGFSTSATSGPTQLNVYPWALNPGVLTLQYNLVLNPGVTVSVPVTSSKTGVGTITGSPITFTTNEPDHTINFQPVAAGTSTLTVGNPNTTVFSTPSQGQQITATVQ